jgi:hypothetical protein
MQKLLSRIERFFSRLSDIRVLNVVFTHEFAPGAATKTKSPVVRALKSFKFKPASGLEPLTC